LPRESIGIRLAWYAAVAAFAVAYLTYNFRLHRADLTVPLTSPEGDSAAFLTLVTAVKEGGWPWRVDRVGAPGVAERLDYPVPEHAQTLALGLLLQFTDNAFLAYNLWALSGYPLAAVCTFGVLRALGVSRPIGFAVAVLFTFQPYHASRAFTLLGHVHTVPLMALPVLWILQGRLPFFRTADGGGGRRFSPWNATTGWTLLIAFLVAVTSAYYAFFGCYFLIVAGLYRGFADRSFRPLLAAPATAAFVVATGFACTLPFVQYQREHGENPAVARRTANEAEVYCLKITQLVLPAETHRVNELGHITRTYNADAPLVNENKDSTLGFVGVAGFVILLGRLLGERSPVRGPMLRASASGPLRGSARPVELNHGLAILTLAAVLLGVSGGFGAVFNFTVFPQIRAYNRVCVFIAFWCLLAVALLVDRWGERRAWLVALPLLALGLWDTTSQHQAPKHAELQRQHETWKDFVERMEAALPPGGMVFQLPAVPYPEAGRVHQMPDYAHLACHSYSRTLRWSYGTNRNRRWAEWHNYVESRPNEEMVQALKTAGFAAIYLDRRGYDPGDADRLIAELRALVGEPVVVSESKDRLLFTLAGPTPEGDRDRLLNRPFALFQRGFLPWAGDEPRRALYEAEVRLVNPDDRVRRVTVSMKWRRRGPTEVTVRVTGPGIDQVRTPSAGREEVTFDLELLSGTHFLKFDSTQRPPWPARFYVAWEATDVRLTVLDGGPP
jgi:hypothetical protein